MLRQLTKAKADGLKVKIMLVPSLRMKRMRNRQMSHISPRIIRMNHLSVLPNASSAGSTITRLIRSLCLPHAVELPYVSRAYKISIKEGSLTSNVLSASKCL